LPSSTTRRAAGEQRQRVGIEGYLRSHSWEDEQGKRRREVELVARRVDFLSGPRDDSSNGEVVPFEAAVA
jgi:single-stranded DNA-binding protein